ncbi:hypothetical protein D3C86_1297530 [compost metagenome]
MVEFLFHPMFMVIIDFVGDKVRVVLGHGRGHVNHGFFSSSLALMPGKCPHAQLVVDAHDEEAIVDQPLLHLSLHRRRPQEAIPD